MILVAADATLVDTGPLYAVFDRRDQHHRSCVETMRTLTGPLVTTWPVLTEAAWLLRRNTAALERLLMLVARRELFVADLEPGAAEWLSGFLARYSSLPAQLADASLVYVAEQTGTKRVFTLDRRDFTVYRLEDGSPLELLPQDLSL